MHTVDDKQTLADIVKYVALPRVEKEGMVGVFVAEPKWHADLALPEGMTAVQKRIQGKRVAVRSKRSYGNFYVKEAVWPKDNLQSMRVPRLFCVMRFPIKMQIGNYVLHCQPGHTILVPPGIPHTEYFTNVSPTLEMLLVMPYHEGLLCWHTQHWEDAKGEPKIWEQTGSIPHSHASTYLSELAEEAADNREHGSLVCDSLIRIFFAVLHRELQGLPILKAGIDRNEIAPMEFNRLAHPIRNAQEYMRRNIRKTLRIDDVARYVGVSRSVFTTEFRNRTGKTFVQYMQDLRFDAACQFLQKGNLNVHHVASAVGLKPDRMRVLFLEREGVPPLEYRRRCLRN